MLGGFPPFGRVNVVNGLRSFVIGLGSVQIDRRKSLSLIAAHDGSPEFYRIR